MPGLTSLAKLEDQLCLSTWFFLVLVQHSDHNTTLTLKGILIENLVVLHLLHCIQLEEFLQQKRLA